MMLERFHVLHQSVQKALIDVKSGTVITEEQLSTISEVVSSLKPVQLAVEALCRRDANLITADATICSLVDCLSHQKGHFVSRLSDNVKLRLLQRRTIASTVLQILHSADYDYSAERILRPSSVTPMQSPFQILW